MKLEERYAMLKVEVARALTNEVLPIGNGT